jgi:hypothetical protein
MPPFDFAAARKNFEDSLSEYESRTNPLERRAPTGPGEYHEPEGWAPKTANELAKAKRHNVGLSADQIYRIKNTDISDEQLRYFNDHEVRVSTDEYILDNEGNTIGGYFRHGLSLPWDDKTADKMLDDLESSTQEFLEHYPPPERDAKDKRFKEGYEEDKARCATENYPIGVFHLVFRR